MAPRAQTAANPSLRNRNRVTNKTRLKVIKGNIDADPIVLDEDEERARVVSTAGVDAEDANEHHLQAVLSAAAHRATTLAQKASSATNGVSNGKNGEPSKPAGSTAYIPVPDAAGIVENVDELYPPGKWVDYTSYIKASDTVEESLLYGLNDGFTYVIDERDAEWLERNNQEARGEGTSSQASATAAGTTTRSGSRGTKSKGKEAETSIPIAMNEDEFELVMGLIEKITHDNTPFLHVSFQQQQASCIPSFSDYHDAFANELPKSHFARFIYPPILPPPSTLVRMAKTIYPYWRERKIEREGQRIIPGLNFDEADTKNESYICFRRRDTKAIRKTRAAQVSSSEKLLRLKVELGHAAELARNVLAREVHKKEASVEAKAVWEKRLAFLDLKRKHPALAGKDDEEVLIEKERPPKRPRSDTIQPPRIKIRPNGEASTSPTPAEPQMRPKDRHAAIQATMDMIAKRIKETDHGWDDQIDSSHQQPPVSLSDRYFKPVSEDSSMTTSAIAERPRAPLYIRLRCGRGGRMLMDRRRPRHAGNDASYHADGIAGKGFDLRRDAGARKVARNLVATELKEKLLEEDRLSRLLERWRFDTVGESTGADEEDRILVDDYDPKHMRVQAMLLNDTEPLMTDTRLLLYDPQTGTHNYVNPVRPIQMVRRDANTYQQPPRPTIQPVPQSSPPQSAPPQPVPMPVSQPVSSIPNPLQSPIKISAPTAQQHVRAASNGPQRSPSSASVSSAQANANPISSSPPNQTTVNHVNGIPPQSSPVNGMPPVPVVSTNTAVNNTNVNGIMNGINLNGTNGLLANLPANLSNLTQAQQQALLLQQQQKQQNVQKFYANYMAANAQRNGQAQYVQGMLNGTADSISAAANLANAVNSANLMASVNTNLKLPAQRQMQWAAAAQRSQSAQGGMVNGTDPTTAMQNLQNMQNMQQLAGLGLLPSHALPTVNGHGNSHLSPPRSAHSPPNTLGHAMSLSPHMGPSPAQSQAHLSPSRNMQTPVPPSPSPLLQHQVANLVGTMPSQGQGF